MRNRHLPISPIPDWNDMLGTAGITKREAAAIAAMQGCIASPRTLTDAEDDNKKIDNLSGMARFAVTAADRLFDELDKERRPDVSAVEVRAEAITETNAAALKFLRNNGHDKAADALEHDLEIPF